MTDSESEMVFRFNEFKAFHKNEDLLNLDTKHLKTKEVTANLDKQTSDYFDRVLRIDNMKITSAQMDFSRVVSYRSQMQKTLLKIFLEVLKTKLKFTLLLKVLVKVYSSL